ncbi:MAG: TolC family protein [Chlorobi bacterium]|nr:TolC family protein [Chlorobiota bacterium]
MKKILSLLLIAIAPGLFGQTNKLTLEESVKLGLQNNKMIQIAESKYRSSGAKVTEAVSNMLPRLSVGGIYNYMSFQNPDALPLFGGLAKIPLDKPLSLYGGSVTLQQPLFTGLKMWSVKSATENSMKAEEKNLSAEKNKIAVEVNKAFWNYFKSKKLKALLEENLKAAENHLRVTKNFLDNGMATQNDYLKMEVQVQKIKLKLVDAENKEKITRSIFNQTIGLKINAETEIETNENFTRIEELNYDRLVSEALRNRDELLAANFMLNAGDDMITAARSGWLPSLYAVGNYYMYNMDAEAIFGETQRIRLWTLGLSLNWNLWDWWNASSKTVQAKEAKFQIEKQSELTKDKVEIEVFSNYLSLISGQKKVDINELTLKSAEENYRLLENKYNNQAATSADLIDAQTELMKAEMELQISKIDFELAKVELYASVGRKLYTIK